MVQRRKNAYERHFVDERFFFLALLLAVIVAIILTGNLSPQLGPIPPGAINVTQCQNLDIPNTYYVLNQTAVNVGLSHCFNITASNITFDGQGNTVLALQSLQKNGIIISPTADDVILKDFIIEEFATGVIVQGGTNHLLSGLEVHSNAVAVNVSQATQVTINNSVIYGNGNSIIFGATQGIISNTFILDGDYGIYVRGADTLIENVTLLAPFIEGIYFASEATGLTVRNTFMTLTQVSGIHILGEGPIFLLNNSLHSNFGPSITIEGGAGSVISLDNDFFNNNAPAYQFESGASNVSIINDVILDTLAGDAILFAGAQGENIALLNVSVTNTVAGADIASSLQSLVPVQIYGGLIDTYDLAGLPITFGYSNASGTSTIEYGFPLIGTGSGLTAAVDLAYNFASVDGAHPLLNQPADISFSGLEPGLDNLTVIRDGVVCSTSICTGGVIEIAPGKVEFFVSGFSNYTVVGQDLSPPLMDIAVPESRQYEAAEFPIIVDVTLDEVGSVWYTLDDGVTNITMQTSNNITFSQAQGLLSDGAYTMHFYAVDEVGNVNATESVDFTVATIDSTAPTITIHFPVDNAEYNDTHMPLEFNVSIDEQGIVRYSLDGGITNVSMVSDDNLSFSALNDSLTNGTYTFTAYAQDLVGNNQSESVLFAFNQSLTLPPDTTAPLVTIVYPENQTYTDAVTPPLYQVVLNEAGSVEYSFDNGVTNTSMGTTDNLTFTAPNTGLGDGAYEFTVFALDVANNTNYTEHVFFVVNTSLPLAVTIDSPISQTYGSSDVPFDIVVTLSGQAESAYYSTDAFVTNITLNTTDNVTFTDVDVTFSDGDYLLEVLVIEFDGNSTYANVTFTVDTTITTGDTGGNDGGDDDGNDGPTGGSGPPPPPNDQDECSDEPWDCGDWTACSESGTQTRECTLVDEGCTEPSPSTQQSCTPPSQTNVNSSTQNSTSSGSIIDSATMTTILFSLVIGIIALALLIVIILIVKASRKSTGIKNATGNYVPPRSQGGGPMTRRRGRGGVSFSGA